MDGDELAETRARFREVHRAIDRSANGTLVIDERGFVLYSNTAAEGMLGRKKHLLAGHRLGIPASIGKTEISVIGADGKSRDAEMSIEPTVWMREKAYLVTLLDVTKRKALNKELATVNQRLEATTLELQRSNNEFQDFAHSAAHDLKAPLRQIRAYAAILHEEERSKLGAESQSHLQYLVDAAERGTALVNRLLEYATVGRRQLEIASIDLNKIVGLVLENSRTIIDEKSIQVEVGDLPAIEGDMRLLEQLFQNLVSNAFKYIRSGIRPVVKLTSKLDEHEGAYEISIQDNGIGFDQCHADRIFDPFCRLVTGNEFDGSGVGLATVRKIVNAHGGAIRVASDPGAGSTFVVTLPVSQHSRTLQQELDSTSAVVALQQPHNSRLRVLVVDDSSTDRDITRHLLADFDIVEAKRAEEAIERLQSREIDAVLSDYNIPDHNGLWLLTRIHAEHPTVRRFLTSDNPPKVLDAFIKRGLVEQFFDKPIDPEQFRRALGSGS